MEVQMTDEDQQKHAAYVAAVKDVTAGNLRGDTSKPHVIITQKDFDELCSDSELLNALRNAGVDNWDGWDFAIESMAEEES